MEGWIWFLLIAGVAGFAALKGLGFFGGPPDRTNPQLVCPHCQTRGQVSVWTERRAKRKTATRITGAVLTAGGSLPATGVSKKGTVQVMHCAHCDMTWDV